MTGRVQKCDLLVVVNCLICADMLGDAAGFAGSYVGLADCIEQRRFAVVNVPKNCDNRRPND